MAELNLGRTQRRRDREKAVKALGQKLRYPEVLHHCPLSGALVICQDEKYHNLIEQRTRALKACGLADWKKCTYCKEHDDPGNLKLHTAKEDSNQMYHEKCAREYGQRRREALKNERIELKVVANQDTEGAD